MTREISPERKIAYYVGACLMVIGFLLFLSVFITGISHFGDSANFMENAKSEGFRAIGGMLLIIVGAVISSIGRMGKAGSGVILDPKQAREDLEPFSRQAGGMLKDALDEAGISRVSAPPGAPPAQVQKVVMIKCLACDKLNEEDSKFCQECGKPL